MRATFYFYDLETSGFNPREARIMQFAGQRTDLNLKPIGKPQNFLIKLSPDVLPEPDAVLITGITPQKTIADGMTEAEFLRAFFKEVVQPETIFAGFNTIRFDDEFMRYLLYRNFYDPYEWQYKEGRSRWDLLDVVRMMRALRPSGIKWPFDKKGQPVNRLELIAKHNKLEHTQAHDALSDVQAVISLARLIKENQPKLFDFLLSIRDKQKVAQLVNNGQPFVYSSGKYLSKYEKTSVAVTLIPHPTRDAVLVYDLRYDPKKFMKLSVDEIIQAWRRRKDEPGPRLPVKTVRLNRCPAVAPLSVMDETSYKRIQLTPELIADNHKKLQKVAGKLAKKVTDAIEKMDKKQQLQFLNDDKLVDARLYDGFFGPSDKRAMQAIPGAKVSELAELNPNFQDKRLRELFPLYKARNFPETLSDQERQFWDNYREHKLLTGKQESRLAKFFARISQLEGQDSLTSQQHYLLEELQLYGQSLLPDDV